MLWNPFGKSIWVQILKDGKPVPCATPGNSIRIFTLRFKKNKTSSSILAFLRSIRYLIFRPFNLKNAMSVNNNININKFSSILGISLLSFWPLYLFMITGELILTNSSYTHYLPLRLNAVRTMLDGHLPLWNPYIFTGITLIGDAVSNPFDILNIILMI